MEVFAHTHGDPGVLGVSFTEGRVFLVDWRTERILHDVRLRYGCSHFDWSPSHDVLVTATHGGPLIEVNVQTGRSTVIHKCIGDVAGVRLANRGTHCVLLLRDETMVRERASGDETRVPDNLGPFLGCELQDGSFMLPQADFSELDGRKNEEPGPSVTHVRFAPLTIQRRAFDDDVYSIRSSPGADCVAIHTPTDIRLLDLDLSLRWRSPIADVNHISFSGDGSLLAATRTKECTLVLDARTGKQVREMEFAPVPSPLTGTQVVSSEGQVVCLATGKIEPGVSRAAWWRARGI